MSEQKVNGAVIASINSLIKVAGVKVEKLTIEGWGDFYFRGLTENEVQRLTKLGGVLKMFKDGSQEYDLSKLKNGGDLELFAMGWVTDETGDKNVIEFRSPPQWNHELKALGNMPSHGFKKGAELVRILSGMNDDEEDEKKDLEMMESDS